ncbi:fructose-bisphosphatase class II [Cryobacterium sp. 10C3]|nr:fructose-bisphosphatase class II [Cryobacterium sp. 10C3]MDY7558140.1 fructose-bisphosphatase class II [Cryobacterium sp. 10C3]
MLGAHSYPAALVARVREATDAAAAACLPWLGRGDKIAIDDAAVTAMRDVLADAPFEGTVVIGEGEKDAAPMLANGEALGQGGAPLCDVAVDPLDGTRLAASGLPGSICVIALAPAARCSIPSTSSTWTSSSAARPATGSSTSAARSPRTSPGSPPSPGSP